MTINLFNLTANQWIFLKFGMDLVMEVSSHIYVSILYGKQGLSVAHIIKGT